MGSLREIRSGKVEVKFDEEKKGRRGSIFSSSYKQRYVTLCHDEGSRTTQLKVFKLHKDDTLEQLLLMELTSATVITISNGGGWGAKCMFKLDEGGSFAFSSAEERDKWVADIRRLVGEAETMHASLPPPSSSSSFSSDPTQRKSTFYDPRPLAKTEPRSSSIREADAFSSDLDTLDEIIPSSHDNLDNADLYEAFTKEDNNGKSDINSSFGSFDAFKGGVQPGGSTISTTTHAATAFEGFNQSPQDNDRTQSTKSNKSSMDHFFDDEQQMHQCRLLPVEADDEDYESVISTVSEGGEEIPQDHSHILEVTPSSQVYTQGEEKSHGIKSQQGKESERNMSQQGEESDRNMSQQGRESHGSNNQEIKESHKNSVAAPSSSSSHRKLHTHASLLANASITLAPVRKGEERRLEHKSTPFTDLDDVNDHPNHGSIEGTPFTALSLQDLNTVTKSSKSLSVYQNPYQWYQTSKLESLRDSDKFNNRKSPPGHGIGALGTGATQSDVALLMQLNQELNEALEIQSKQHSYEIDLLNSIVLEYRRKEKEAEERCQEGQEKNGKTRSRSTSPSNQTTSGKRGPSDSPTALNIPTSTSISIPLPEDPADLELVAPYLRHIENLDLVNKETLQKLQRLGNIMVEKDEVISVLKKKGQEMKQEEDEKEEKRRADQINHLESQIESLDRQNKALFEEAQSFKSKYEELCSTQEAIVAESSELETSLRNDLNDYETEYEVLATLKDELVEKVGTLEEANAALQEFKTKMESSSHEDHLIIENKTKRIEMLNEENESLRKHLEVEVAKARELSIENIKLSVENEGMNDSINQLKTNLVEKEQHHSEKFNGIQMKFSSELEILREQLTTLRQSSTDKDVMILELNSRLDKETCTRMQLEEKVNIFDRRQGIEEEQLKGKSDKIMELEGQLSEMSIAKLQCEQQLSILSDQWRTKEREAANALVASQKEVELLKARQDAQLSAIATLEKEIDSRHQALIEEKNATIEHIRSLEESLRTSQRGAKELEIINSCQTEEYKKESTYLKDNIKRLEEELQAASQFQAEFKIRVDTAEKKINSDKKEVDQERHKRILLEQSINEKDKRAKELEARLEACTQELTTTNLAVQSTQSELQNAQQNLATVRQALDSTKYDLSTERQKVESILKEHKISEELWSTSEENMKSQVAALEKALEGSQLALANTLDKSESDQINALEKSSEAEKCLVSFLKGGSKLIKSLLSMQSSNLNIPWNECDNGFSSLMDSLGIPYRGIAGKELMNAGPSSPYKSQAKPKSSKTKSRRRSESKSESKSDLNAEAKAESKSSPRRSSTKKSKGKSKEASIHFRISKIVCKDGAHYFQGPTIQFSFGEWSQSTTAENRVNDELVVAGKSIRWFEWDELDFIVKAPSWEFTCQLMDVLIMDEFGIVGNTSINLSDFADVASSERAESKISADVIGINKEKTAQITLFISYEKIVNRRKASNNFDSFDESVFSAAPTDLDTSLPFSDQGDLVSTSSSHLHDHAWKSDANVFMQQLFELYHFTKYLTRVFNNLHECISVGCANCSDLWGSDITDCGERFAHRHHAEILRLDNVDPNDMCNLKIVEAKILLLIQEYAELRQREMLQCEETTASQASTRVTGEVDPTFESKLDDLFA